jgi:hypothetical protein
MANENGNWGEGLDYLFKEIWPNLDQIRADNEDYKHDKDNIEHCFGIMYSALSKDAVEVVKTSDWVPADKFEVLKKITETTKLFKEARTINDKVIAINVAEQLLRAMY